MITDVPYYNNVAIHGCTVENNNGPKRRGGYRFYQRGTMGSAWSCASL